MSAVAAEGIARILAQKTPSVNQRKDTWIYSRLRFKHKIHNQTEFY